MPCTCWPKKLVCWYRSCADFGDNCRAQIITKLQRRQANWKLDPPLRKACKASVQSLCASEEASQSENGMVYKCLVNKYESIAAGCQKELGRAMHMAFFAYQPGAILTQVRHMCMHLR